MVALKNPTLSFAQELVREMDEDERIVLTTYNYTMIVKYYPLPIIIGSIFTFTRLL